MALHARDCACAAAALDEGCVGAADARCGAAAPGLGCGVSVVRVSGDGRAMGVPLSWPVVVLRSIRCRALPSSPSTGVVAARRSWALASTSGSDLYDPKAESMPAESMPSGPSRAASQPRPCDGSFVSIEVQPIVGSTTIVSAASPLPVSSLTGAAPRRARGTPDSRRAQDGKGPGSVRFYRCLPGHRCCSCRCRSTLASGLLRGGLSWTCWRTDPVANTL